MYQVIRNIIDGGNYTLHTLIEKIDRFYAEDKLTLEERTDLTQRARAGAEAQSELNVYDKLQELEQRIRAIEDTLNNHSETADPFVEGTWYYNGDRVLFNGKVYECIAPAGVVCVWSPEVYPSYWQEI